MIRLSDRMTTGDFYNEYLTDDNDYRIKELFSDIGVKIGDTIATQYKGNPIYTYRIVRVEDIWYSKNSVIVLENTVDGDVIKVEPLWFYTRYIEVRD